MYNMIIRLLIRSAKLCLVHARETFLFFCFFLPQFFCEAFKHYLKLLGQIWLTFEFFYISLVFPFS
jgi:hypothetical protein